MGINGGLPSGVCIIMMLLFRVCISGRIQTSKDLGFKPVSLRFRVGDLRFSGEGLGFRPHEFAI